jgi:hypothetical protein
VKLIAASTLALIVASAAFADHGKIKWRPGKEHDAALAEAKSSGVPVLIYFTGEN